METKCTQQEILLFTNTSFGMRELAENGQPGQQPLFNSAREKWKAGVWNGLLGDLLPEIMERGQTGKPLFLWNIYEGNHFLGIELAEQLLQPEQEFSINPQAVLATMHEN